MRRFFSRRGVAVAAVALAVGIGALGAYGAASAGSALASTAMGFGPWGGGHVGGPGGGPWAGASAVVPPEIMALRDLPPAERFKHFNGVQVSLKDANNQPVQIVVTAGTVSAASASSLTLAANDGSTKTYSIDGQTVIRSRPSDGSPNNTPNLTQGDMVVVVSRNSETAARAIMDGNKEGFGGPMGGHGR